MIQPAIPYTGEPATLPLHMIESQPQIRMRNGFDRESLAELSSTIQEHGLLQPLVVRRLESDRYELIAGERRLLACSMAGLAEVPVLIRDVIDADVPALQAIENLQRMDLTLLDRADGVAAIVDKLGAKRAASVLGKSPGWVSKLVQIAKQPDALRELAEHVEDVESLGLLRQLRQADKESFAKVAARLTDGGSYSRDQLAGLVKQAKGKPTIERPTGEDAEDDLFGQPDAPAAKPVQTATVTVARAAALIALEALNGLLDPANAAAMSTRDLVTAQKALADALR